MDLFDYMREQNTKTEGPLASRMRPETLDEVVGQEHILGKDKLLTRAIRADKLGSVILFGPPGTGKTTIAKVIANTTHAEFRQLNATTSGKKDMEEVVAAAMRNKGAYGTKTILFIDEIHRFNKAQQDYLLPYVEDGTITLIGATTENPFFEVNRALLSRSRLFELKPLSAENIRTLILRAVSDEKKGMGMYHAYIDDNAADFLSDIAEGDARAALNAVELAVLTTDPGPDGRIHLTLDIMQECIQKRAIGYDKDGNNHYDTISAFIKSMRGSDPDAAAYYVARMLEAGEDIKFIARRIMICASEDVGNADPMALTVAVSASLAVERVGLPEANIILTHAATYVASAPKSNAVVCAIEKAQEVVRKTGNLPIPVYLRDVHFEDSGKPGEGEGRFAGNGTGYKYAHNYPNNYVEQQYLPDAVRDEHFYHPTDNGHEHEIREYFRRIGRKLPGDELWNNSVEHFSDE
ncbi:MAG: replication-associated recombination protein A [Lachnospiraceae bacterium]|nr:replication-associated recombination protein A [Lachnospiraceae bacterium]